MRRRVGLAVLLGLLLCLALPGVAGAQDSYTGLDLVHRERLRVGPYELTVAVTRWPMRSEQSVDMVFMPSGGIRGKRGTVTLRSPSGTATVVAGVGRGDGNRFDLAPHPRMPEAWGLDIVALPEEGRWSWEFTIEGPQGQGTGSLPARLGPRPGPPLWVGLLPVLLGTAALLGLVVLAWLRVRPERRPEAKVWDLQQGSSP